MDMEKIKCGPRASITAMAAAALVCTFFGGAAFAHAPVFMLSPDAPGKEAFDLHTEVTHSRQGNERNTELEQEFTYGLTRNLVVGTSVPLARNEKTLASGVQSASTGIDNPRFFGQWRFWDKDTLGAKRSSAIRMAATLPAGDKIIARNKPDFMVGAAYGMESIKWYYMFDARYLYRVDDAGVKPGDRFYADAAVGLRPHLAKLEETDTVLFLELNYMNEARGRFGGVDNRDSGGSFLYISPEVLISPTNRLMIRGGVQIPVYQQLQGAQEPEDLTFKFIIESRF